MSETLAHFAEYLSYPFVKNALIVGTLIALCSALLGVTLVLRRFSFIGDGLSHTAFGALAVAAVLHLSNEMLLVLPVTVLCAVLLLGAGKNKKTSGDASVAMLSVGAMAFGYLLLNLFPSSGNVAGDVCSSLFGSTSILTLTRTEVALCVVLSVLVLAAFVLLYRRLFAVTFDAGFAEASGVSVGFYNLLIAVISAVIIVLAMNLVGSLLVSALLIFPALSAMRVFRSFFGVTVCAGILSVVCTLSGILASILFDTPVGATVVAADVFAYFLFSLIGKGKGA
ncbi:MAG: metal ABC transporter permease [Clostridia bacterium]|nr:metal ABC transporter permease [Clostridia bacterium]